MDNSYNLTPPKWTTHNIYYPNKAYNELKTKAYDKGKASKKKRVN